jgi:flagellin
MHLANGLISLIVRFDLLGRKINAFKKMSIKINTNIQSLFAQRSLGRSTNALNISLERLSTGYRINRAADDAAGLSISSKLTSQIRSLTQANKNAADGISLIQTAEGGLDVIQENLQRIRELMVQAANGISSVNELNAIQREINRRIEVIDDISQETQYNGIEVLQSSQNIVLQTGYQDGDTTTIEMVGLIPNSGIFVDVFATSGFGELSEGTSIALADLRIPGSTVWSYNTVNADNGTLNDIDIMINNISRMRSYLGAKQNSLESKIDFINVAYENYTSARSRIIDTDVAKESSNLIRNQILQAAAAMLAQANSQPRIALSLLPGYQG